MQVHILSNCSMLDTLRVDCRLTYKSQAVYLSDRMKCNVDVYFTC